jgi:hypothetical protein
VFPAWIIVIAAGLGAYYSHRMGKRYSDREPSISATYSIFKWVLIIVAVMGSIMSLIDLAAWVWG